MTARVRSRRGCPPRAATCSRAASKASRVCRGAGGGGGGGRAREGRGGAGQGGVGRPRAGRMRAARGGGEGRTARERGGGRRAELKQTRAAPGVAAPHRAHDQDAAVQHVHVVRHRRRHRRRRRRRRAVRLHRRNRVLRRAAGGAAAGSARGRAARRGRAVGGRPLAAPAAAAADGVGPSDGGGTRARWRAGLGPCAGPVARGLAAPGTWGTMTTPPARTVMWCTTFRAGAAAWGAGCGAPPGRGGAGPRAGCRTDGQDIAVGTRPLAAPGAPRAGRSERRRRRGSAGAGERPDRSGPARAPSLAGWRKPPRRSPPRRTLSMTRTSPRRTVR
jgi:hypothetical protein